MAPVAARKPAETTESHLIAEVYERKSDPGVWGVEAIDMQRDGDCYVTLFAGPEAKERAVEYAAWKFQDFKVK